MENWILRPSSLLYWRLSEGLGIRGRFDVEYAPSKACRLLLTPQVTWSEGTDGVHWEQGASIVWTTGPDGLIGTDFALSFSTRPSMVLSNGFWGIRYRHRLWRKWFFVEFSPRVNFPRETDYAFTPSFQIRADIVFE